MMTQNKIKTIGKEMINELMHEVDLCFDIDTLESMKEELRLIECKILFLRSYTDNKIFLLKP